MRGNNSLSSSSLQSCRPMQSVFNRYKVLQLAMSHHKLGQSYVTSSRADRREKSAFKRANEVANNQTEEREGELHWDAMLPGQAPPSAPHSPKGAALRTLLHLSRWRIGVAAVEPILFLVSDRCARPPCASLTLHIRRRLLTQGGIASAHVSGTAREPLPYTRTPIACVSS